MKYEKNYGRNGVWGVLGVPFPVTIKYLPKKKKQQQQ